MRAARDTELAAAAEQLLLAATWADLHPVARGGTAAGWGERDLHGEGVGPLAGEGTPAVAEFAPAELAAYLGLHLDAGKYLVADALELRHRLPRLWALVHDRTLPAWRARQVAALTTPLDPEAATRVDRWLACDPAHLTRERARRVVHEALLSGDPDRARADEESALASRHVRLLHEGGPATTDVLMRLDALDALQFDETLTDLATGLLDFGDDPGPQRRTAVELVLHVDAADLADPDRSGGSVERLGAATRDLLAAWLARPGLGGVRVRPVLDLNRLDAVDRHDPPDWMREAALLRDATCGFPGCTRDSRHADLDHIEPYVPPGEGGPPGQTSLVNLAPLCRTHHRLKTHAGWSYTRLDDNTFVWQTPTGSLLAVRTRRRRS